MLNEKQYTMLSLIDQETRWEGSERPGRELTRYFVPKRHMQVGHTEVLISGSGDAATIRSLWKKGYARQHGPVNPYASIITESGMVALEQYREKHVYGKA